MARKRLSEEVRKTIAARLHNGEETAELANEFGVSKYTINEYGRQFPAKTRRVMRKVAPQKETNNGVVWLRGNDLMFYNNAIYKKVQDIE